jgi:hypothetical protein
MIRPRRRDDSWVRGTAARTGAESAHKREGSDQLGCSHRPVSCLPKAANSAFCPLAGLWGTANRDRGRPQAGAVPVLGPGDVRFLPAEYLGEPGFLTPSTDCSGHMATRTKCLSRGILPRRGRRSGATAGPSRRRSGPTGLRETFRARVLACMRRIFRGVLPEATSGAPLQPDRSCRDLMRCADRCVGAPRQPSRAMSQARRTVIVRRFMGPLSAGQVTEWPAPWRKRSTESTGSGTLAKSPRFASPRAPLASIWAAA